MKQEQLIQQQHLAIRIWIYISKPFQINKVLELLYMLDWLWYAILSYLPSSYTGGTLFTTLRSITTPFVISIIFTSIAVIHSIALMLNVIALRKAALLFNIGILFYLTSAVFATNPYVAAGIGYYIILIGVSIFAFLRMDETG
jgi:hypothetical protein